MNFTLNELMVAAAAREIKDGEVVFVGMRLPLIAFVVAKKTHAPNAVGLFENGVIRTTPSPELIYTMADPPNILGATQCLDMMGVMSLLQAGRVHLGFLGAAEVDREVQVMVDDLIRGQAINVYAVTHCEWSIRVHVRRRPLIDSEEPFGRRPPSALVESLFP